MRYYKLNSLILPCNANAYILIVDSLGYRFFRNVGKIVISAEMRKHYCTGSVLYKLLDTESNKGKPHNGIDPHGIVRLNDRGRHMLDLKRVNAVRLTQLGVPEAHIAVSDLCTMCMPETFWSHRATNGARGVQAAIVTL